MTSVAAMPQAFAVLAGGTGGHIYPALAVAEELAGRGYAIHWFGTHRGLEQKVVPAAGHALHMLEVEGLRGRRPGGRLRALGMATGALGRVFAAMHTLKPAGALGLGGYVAGPAGLAAWLAGVPLVIHEQNSVAGTANRLLRRFARRVLCAYPGAFSGGGAELTGNPVRAELVARGKRATYGFNGGRPLRLLVLGGSQGARALNEAVPPALKLLPPGAIEIKHQTGPQHLAAAQSAYRAAGGEADGPPGVELIAYIEDMAAAYEWADLALCRAGALTLAELTVMGRPAILAPLPGSIDNHQARNADWLSRAGAAAILPPPQFNPHSLAGWLKKFLAHPAQLGAMARAAAAAARPDATQAVADICEEVRRG